MRQWAKQIEAVAVAQSDVDQHELVRFAVHGRQALGQAGGRVGGVALLAEPVGHRAEHVAIVVDQQKCSELFHVFYSWPASQCGLFRKCRL